MVQYPNIDPRQSTERGSSNPISPGELLASEESGARPVSQSPEAASQSTVDEQSRPKRSWRNLFVRKGFQVRFIIQLSLMVAGFFVLIIATVFGPSVFVVLSSSASDLARSDSAIKLLALNEAVWPALFLSFAFLAVVGIRISHRIAGPIYRMLYVMENLDRGQIVTDIRFRPGDLLQEEASVINATLSSLRARVQALQNSRAELSTLIEEVVIEASEDSSSVNPLAERLLAKDAELADLLDALVIEAAADPIAA